MESKSNINKEKENKKKKYTKEKEIEIQNPKSNITQLSQNTNKQINIESVSSLQDFGVEVDKNASEKPTEIEKKHVYEVYDKISAHFSHTRYKPWPQVAEFLNSLEKDS